MRLSKLAKEMFVCVRISSCQVLQKGEATASCRDDHLIPWNGEWCANE